MRMLNTSTLSLPRPLHSTVTLCALVDSVDVILVALIDTRIAVYTPSWLNDVSLVMSMLKIGLGPGCCHLIISPGNVQVRVIISSRQGLSAQLEVRMAVTAWNKKIIKCLPCSRTLHSIP